MAVTNDNEVQRGRSIETIQLFYPIMGIQVKKWDGA